MYNVEVDEFHTFYVGGEDWGFRVWVHNDQLCELIALIEVAKDAASAAQPLAELRGLWRTIPTANYATIAEMNGGSTLAKIIDLGIISRTTLSAADAGVALGKLYRLGKVAGAQLGVGTIRLDKSQISTARDIATGRRIDKIDTLITIFGGKANDWVKKSTTAGNEIHWYQGPGGIKVGMKNKSLGQNYDPF